MSPTGKRHINLAPGTPTMAFAHSCAEILRNSAIAYSGKVKPPRFHNSETSTKQKKLGIPATFQALQIQGKGNRVQPFKRTGNLLPKKPKSTNQKQNKKPQDIEKLLLRSLKTSFIKSMSATEYSSVKYGRKSIVNK